MAAAMVWEERVVIPTYGVGEEEKNPMFLEKRVYQGSSGKVYPYATIEHISTEKTDKEYNAVMLENEYLKVMVLPELGGRIQRAYDKTNGYDFVYYNHVIKPALVGLLGPWISGGIEFNWPQHHRPTTYMPVDFELERGPEGSAAVLLHEVDQINGTKGILRIALYPGRAYIEVSAQLYNRTSLPQTFLWWANPAVPVNDQTQSIFPPDVHAVMDHGKRDVSRFPIATGVYYKKDYSEGVDISRYKNIPVPTSYMAEKSKYDFVGGYDYGREAGILHVADHHISPGKKQWTWGCGEFGKAWDRNLTDEDGPYVELMTGVYTDNQPDFSWLKPFEEKTFTQYFMPYKKVGRVSNATKEAVLGIDLSDGVLSVAAYATAVRERAELMVEQGGRLLYREQICLSPEQPFEKRLPLRAEESGGFCVSLWEGGRCLVSYRPEPERIEKLPQPARAPQKPEEVRTNEELFLAGQHIEQYRHATYLPDPYYLEGLKRDPGDIRVNNAYGLLLLRRGDFAGAERCFRKALERLTERNPNPYDSEPFFHLGLALFRQGRSEEAYDAFYKAAWSGEQQEMSYYFMAALRSAEEKFAESLAFLERSLVRNSHNVKARALRVYLLRKLGRREEAARQAEENLAFDPFDYVSGWEQVALLGDAAQGEAYVRCRSALERRMRGAAQNYLMCARDYAEFGAHREAAGVLSVCPQEYPLVGYYLAFELEKVGEAEKAAGQRAAAERMEPGSCFPNRLEDIAVLEDAIAHGALRRAPYYLGCLFYDKRQYARATALWEQSAEADGTFPTVFRNLSFAYYNKAGDPEKAHRMMERAFALDPEDARVFLERDQLARRLGHTNAERLSEYETHRALTLKRDDLYVEYVTLLNVCGQIERAFSLITGRQLHPWEGGEGRALTQYTLLQLRRARRRMEEQDWAGAEMLLREALDYPETLGEGKLEGTKDNHIYYHLGEVLEQLGRQEEARECYERAVQGTDEPAGVMYYNDQPADMILYQGLAYRKLGNRGAANARFYRLLDFGEQHLDDEVEIEYFAVSLPDFVIYDEDYTKRGRAHCCYLMGLAQIGLGDRGKAKKFFEEALQIEPCHMMASLYLEELGRIGQ